MRARSTRMRRVYRDRWQVVAAFLEEHPTCQRCWRRRATEVHEVLSRGRGGSILDGGNLRALCHVCHRWVTENPAAATAEGFLSSATAHRFVLGDRMSCQICRLPPQNWRHRVDAAG